eukprot:TRINITY_DN44164_c0_g1_i1.p1 TRINITY_DN44164_c0_g1~~TRINITY_DN44164_c0_g1_i1.p1  ORF type:complete len:144 (+),score=41.70 TRINITY_DN44164_c0_g1_i1:143-574(+)
MSNNLSESSFRSTRRGLERRERRATVAMQLLRTLGREPNELQGGVQELVQAEVHQDEEWDSMLKNSQAAAEADAQGSFDCNKWKIEFKSSYIERVQASLAVVETEFAMVYGEDDPEEAQTVLGAYLRLFDKKHTAAPPEQADE